MRLWDITQVGLKRVVRIAMLVIVIGVIPVLIVGCFRSFIVIDHIDITHQNVKAAWQIRLGSGEGNLFFFWTHHEFQSGDSPRNYFGSPSGFQVWQDHGPFDARDEIHILKWQTDSGRVPGYRSIDVRIGYPTLIVLAGIFLFWRVRNFRQRRRAAMIARNLCPSCEYDLRASPERCPECGKPSSSAAT